jgi:hypothetical protein
MFSGERTDEGRWHFLSNNAPLLLIGFEVHELFWMKAPIASENGDETTSVWQQHYLFQ